MASVRSRKPFGWICLAWTFFALRSLAEPTLVVVGDSLTADRPANAVAASWARALEKYMKPGCTIDNHAKSGASTKSFFVSGRWAKVVEAVKPGDYVLIQFGANDQKWHTDFHREKRFADHKTTFRDYIRRFVKEARAKGGKPVLVSENVRGTFDAEGRLFDEVDAKGISLSCYVQAMREMSEELKTEFVDMNKLTHDLLSKLGKEESLKFYVISSGTTDPKTGKPSTDTTHTVKAGAEAYARLFLEDVKKRNLDVAEIFLHDGSDVPKETVIFENGAYRADIVLPAKPLRMVTYNIYGDWRAPKWGVPPRAAGIERTIVKAQPDVVALQEVVGDWWESPLFANLSADYGIVRGDVDEAIRRAGPPPVTKPGKLDKGQCNHTPLLYRKDRLSLIDSGYDIFHIALGGMSKSVTWAVLEDKRSGRRFMSFSTHFWFKHNGPESDAIRELNVRNILGHVAEVRRKWGDIPVIGGGDLNCNQGSLALETFRREGYSNAMEVAAEKTVRSATRSYHGRLKRDENGRYHGTVAPPGRDKPEQSIDHIFFTGGIRAMRYDIDVDAESLDASDHSPVIVDFAIK